MRSAIRSQEQAVIDWLATGRRLTSLQALNRWGVARLAARIERLRKQGHRIVSDRVSRGGKCFAAYRLSR